MTNYQFLQTYFELQKGVAFDELIDLHFSTLCYNKLDPFLFWNNALVNENLSMDQVLEVEQQFKQLKRKSAFYFEDRSDLNSLTQMLQTQGYTQEAEDSLMFHSGIDIEENRFHQVKKVENLQDLDVFIHTFDKCYQEGDPQNPYGTLGEYLLSARSAWERNHESNKLEYFIAYKHDQPVAVSALTNHKNIGYISNVGSLQAVRGEGYGKLATLYCVAQSKKYGHTEHSIATEEGTYPNQFYKKIGFVTRFTSKLMVKE